MRKHLIAAGLLFASAALGQDVTRVYHFTNLSNPQGYQEIANTMRTAGDLRAVTVDSAAASLTASGTIDQIALADWLVSQLDQPPVAPPSPAYQMAGEDGQVRVFRLAHAAWPRDVQEIVNVLRTTTEINRIFPVSECRSIVARGTAAQIALSEWLVARLDVTGPSPGAPVQARQLEGVRDPEVRFIPLAHTLTPQALQELVNSIRTVADLNRVFPCNTPAAIVLRGSPEYVALAEWLVGQLDQAPMHQGPAPHRQDVAARYDPVARVFYLNHAGTPATLLAIVNTLRTNAKVNRVFPCNQAQAVSVRGTTDQVAEAEKLVAQLDR